MQRKESEKMKASESTKNFSSKLKENTNYCLREIKHICSNFDKRGSGSKGERQAQEYMASRLKDWADDVNIEEFTLHPAAFMAWVIICGIGLIASVLFYNFVSPLISMIILLLCGLSVIMEFLMYKQFIDPFFPKKTSANVVAIRKPKGEVKRRIIFSGHCDAAHEWYFTHLGGAKLLTTVIVIGFASLIFTIVSSIIAVAQGYFLTAPVAGFAKTLGTIQYFLIPVGIIVLFFTNWRLTVDGANDNLTGVVGSMAVLKFMADNDIRFENTEVRAVLTGSEEAGLRGSKAYSKKHLKECQEIETAFVGLETFRDFEHLAIYSRDMTGTVKNDPKVCALIKKAASEAGLDLPYKSVFFGSSDAAAVSQAGIPAATLASMDPAPARYYHTRRDTADNLDSKTMQAGLNIALETAFLFDEKGLRESY